MEWTIGRCDNYFESIMVGLVAGVVLVICIPIFVVLFSITAVCIPIMGILGMIKRK